ncbi:MAG: 50S ribosomal protein L10 [Caldisericia bacterium]|nr:50S ribosomal protein L10 [Caldisericia bacterium]
MITRNQKEQICEKMAETWKEAKSLVFYSYEKMKDSELTDFRMTVNKSGCHAFVTKNTLFLKSAEQAGIELDEKIANEIFNGMTGVVYSIDDPIEAPKTVKEFAKGKKKPVIKGGYFEGKLLSKQEAIKLASIPPREVLLGQVAYCIKGPTRNLAVVLNNTLTKVCWALNAVKQEKEQNA